MKYALIIIDVQSDHLGQSTGKRDGKQFTCKKGLDNFRFFDYNMGREYEKRTSDMWENIQR